MESGGNPKKPSASSSSSKKNPKNPSIFGGSGGGGSKQPSSFGDVAGSRSYGFGGRGGGGNFVGSGGGGDDEEDFDLDDYRRTADATMINYYWYVIIATIAPFAVIVYVNVSYVIGAMLTIFLAILCGFSLLFDWLESNPRKKQADLNVYRRGRILVFRLSLAFFFATLLWIAVTMLQKGGP